MTIQFDGKSVYLDTKSINFDYNVGDVGVLADKFIVLLDIPVDVKNVHSNIYAFSLEGELLWSVQPIEDKFPKLESVEPFVSMSYVNNKLYGVDFFGRRFEINQNDGKLVSMDIVK